MSDGQSGILVGVELDKRKASVGLHADFNNIAIALEKRNEIGLSGVGNEVADIDSSVELGCLGSNSLK